MKIFILGKKILLMLVSTAIGLDATGALAAEKIEFQTYTPQDYAEILNGQYKKTSITIQGYLSKPKIDGKVPVVVIIPGSGGYKETMQKTLAQPLNDAGIATFIIDSFTARGVNETGSNQGTVPMSASVMDGFQALNYLASRPDIDARHIGVTGFSRGGVVSMFTNEKRLQGAINPDGPLFAAHLPVYPGCSTQWMDPQPGTAPMQFLMGEKDDLTPAYICTKYIDKLTSKGGKVTSIIYSGVHHNWFSDKAVATNSTIQNYGRCDLKIEDSGQIKDMKSGATTINGWSQFVNQVMQSCGFKGATLGANLNAQNESIKDMTKFFATTLKVEK
jgi:dienelactone hydrolase